MINSAAVILKYKQPAVVWINSIEPDDQDFLATVELVNQDRNVYLISEEDAGDEDALDDWIVRNYMNLFEVELQDWCTDSEIWPNNLTLDLFHEWFQVRCHSVIVDTVDTKIVDDEV